MMGVVSGGIEGMFAAGALAGTGESGHESSPSVLSSEVSSTGSSCMHARTSKSFDCVPLFGLASLAEESRRNSGKLRHALQDLTLNTFRDPAGKALVESVKAILAGDGESNLTRECKSPAEASVQIRSSQDALQTNDLCAPAAEADAPYDDSMNTSVDCNNSSPNACLPGACLPRSQQHDQSADANLNDWQVWASHVSELLSTFSTELVSLGARVDQVCLHLDAPKSISSSLPCIVEEASIVSESEATLGDSKFECADSCEQRFSILASRLDAIEESLKLHSSTERASRFQNLDISLSSECTAPGDEFLDLHVSTARNSHYAEDKRVDVPQLNSLRPLGSPDVLQIEQKLRDEVFPVQRGSVERTSSLTSLCAKQRELRSPLDLRTHERLRIDTGSA
eukprot:CAMPEP_0169125260 /NCGR_PEP_ID=MMETSP1015-20121227/34783_1 /TAXON_ID=342587 /ORGANISM="Karlodinium micrum, Strain CCMP2283" /LENGTH=396 /DNA_ID=CAMNT_0009188771 /DNA_START=27 /DNA_END=1214 /DNA_ORIENTATION=+